MLLQTPLEMTITQNRPFPNYSFHFKLKLKIKNYLPILLPMDTIPFETFAAVDLRVGLVTHAEPVPDSKKLIKLTVDFSSEQRTILAGMAQYYDPEDFINKKFGFVFNLAPKSMAGIESQGMMLAADNGDSPILWPIPDDAQVGSKIR